MKNTYLTLLSLLALSYSHSQLVTFPSGPPYELNQNILMGPNVSMSNVVHTGDPYSISFYTANGTNLGITSGIHMNTGTIFNNGNGPQGPNNMSGCGFDNAAAGNTMLSTLIGGTSTHDASILEFDFIPAIDTIRLHYIFGSEEYPEYVGSTFNDVFAIFISGPGITGQQNIAETPNFSGTFVNSINATTNSAYYVSNGDGTQAPYNASSTYVQYDGYTTTLEAKSAVQIGQTYHMIIAIADAGDGILDSGVFLETEGINVGVNKKTAEKEELEIFPNPTSSDATLKITLPKQVSVSYNVVNTLGQLVEDENLGSLKEGVHSIELATKNYPTGVYFVRVKMGEQTMTKKVIIK